MEIGISWLELKKNDKQLKKYSSETTINSYTKLTIKLGLCTFDNSNWGDTFDNIYF